MVETGKLYAISPSLMQDLGTTTDNAKVVAIGDSVMTIKVDGKNYTISRLTGQKHLSAPKPPKTVYTPTVVVAKTPVVPTPTPTVVVDPPVIVVEDPVIPTVITPTPIADKSLDINMEIIQPISQVQTVDKPRITIIEVQKPQQTIPSSQDSYINEVDPF
jgi:hypothetical protein